MPIQYKISQKGESIFSVMSGMAREAGALNLAQGYPDYDCSPALAELISKAVMDGHNQYAPMPGILTLREIIAQKTDQQSGRKYDVEDEITVVPGATLGIYAVIAAVVSKGDEVILFDPAYDSYEPSVEMAGGTTIRLPLTFPDYQVDWDRFKKTVSRRTKLVVVNTPHNPTGSIFSEEDWAQLADILKDTDSYVLSDEVYEHIVFDGHRHLSAASHPAIAERAFVISSFGKTYHTTGWKMGYVLAPASLSAAIRKVYQFMAFSAHTPTQHAYAKILEDKSSYTELGAYYQQKRDLFRQLLASSRFDLLPTSGSYFQLLGYSSISQESDVSFAERLTKAFKIASIPVSVFYGDQTDHHVLRFCFAKKDETLRQASDILCKI